jgi:hypothetical protein
MPYLYRACLAVITGRVGAAHLKDLLMFFWRTQPVKIVPSEDPKELRTR